MLNQTYSIYYDSICPCVHRNIIGNSVEILSTTLSVICVILIDWKCSMQHDGTPGSSENLCPTKQLTSYVFNFLRK